VASKPCVVTARPGGSVAASMAVHAAKPSPAVKVGPDAHSLQT
jgi:hypothetical protein